MSRTIPCAALVIVLALTGASTLPAQGGRAQKKAPVKRAMLVTTATGPDARQFVELKLHFDRKFARHRAKAAAKLASKGWKPADALAVVTLQAEPGGGGAAAVARRIWDALVPALAAQTVHSNGEGPFEGVVVYESWDDGDETTWEGMSYFENYDTGQAFSAISQEWTGGDYEHVHWAESVGYDPPSDDPPPYLAKWLPEGAGRRQRMVLTSAAARAEGAGCMGAIKEAAMASDAPASGPFAATESAGAQDPGTPTSCPCPVYGGEEPIASCAMRVGITRSWVWCGSVFAGCRWAGSLWKACGIGCAARALSETLVEGYRWYRDCTR